MKERFEKRIMLSPKSLITLTQIDEMKGLWRGSASLSPQILGKLRKSVIVTSTGASTRIEGSKMTDDEVERFLKALKTNPPENRDEEEVAGYANLLGRVFDNWRTLKVSESLILQFHEILLHFAKKDQLHKGKYKTRENLVVAINASGKQTIIFKPTEAWLTKKEMDDVLYWLDEAFQEKKLHPLLIIANFVFEFLAIHPFIDGNGRLSRALTNLLLLQAGYEYVPYVSLEEIIEENRDAYLASLRQTQKSHKTEQEDIGPWVDFFLDTLLEQANKANQLIENDDPTKLLSEHQKKIYEMFDSELISVLDIKKMIPEIHEQTIKQALRKLVSLKLIEVRGLGRGTRYVKTKNTL